MSQYGSQGGFREDTLGTVSYDDARAISRAFNQLRDARGYVPTEAAWAQLEQRTGLPHDVLKDILQKSDLDRDNRLSLREFVCAMHLGDRVRHGQRTPIEVTPEQQGILARGVEKMIGQNNERQQPSDNEEKRKKDQQTHQLGPLASVFKAKAEHETAAELEHMSEDVVRERQDLAQELAMQRELKDQLKEVRVRTNELQDEHLRASAAAANIAVHNQHLEAELKFLQDEVKLADADFEHLHAVTASRNGNRRDLHSMQGERELWSQDKNRVQEMLLKIDDLQRQKARSREDQQVLLEHQRQSEHDRNLLLTAIENEHEKLSAMRAERLGMWEERTKLERELQDLKQADVYKTLSPTRLIPGIGKGIRH